MIRKIIFISLLTTSAAFSADKYFNADNYSKNQNYAMAALEYDKIIETSGSVAISDDIRALTGSFISHYMLQEYEASFARCKRVLRLDSYNSAAILYSGLNLEAMDNIAVAGKLLRYHSVLSKSDPYRRFIKVKYDQLAGADTEKQVRSAIEAEKKLKAPLLSENSIVMLFLVNERDDIKWNAFGRGFTQILLNDLSGIKNLKVVGSEQLLALSSVLQAENFQLINENVMRRIARIFQSRYIVGGFYKVSDIQNVAIDLAFIDLRQAQKTERLEFSGRTVDFYKMKKEIIKSLLSTMDISITKKEERQLNFIPTKNIDAFMAYCNALQVYEYKNFIQASSYLNESLRIDPRFVLAKELSGNVDALMTISNNELALYHFQMGQQGGAYSNLEVISFSRERMNNMSLNLDLGYLPGNESRNGAGGVYIPDIIEPVKLGEPPKPPGN